MYRRIIIGVTYIFTLVVHVNAQQYFAAFPFTSGITYLKLESDSSFKYAFTSFNDYKNENDFFGRLEQVGIGTFSLNNSRICLRFDKKKISLPFFTKDSLVCSFSTNPINDSQNICLSFHSSLIPERVTLTVVTASGGFSKSIYSKGVLRLPAKEIITEIKFSCIGISEKTLPFSAGYNDISYDYYLKQKETTPNILLDTTITFAISDSATHKFDIIKLKPIDKHEIYYNTNFSPIDRKWLKDFFENE